MENLNFYNLSKVNVIYNLLPINVTFYCIATTFVSAHCDLEKGSTVILLYKKSRVINKVENHCSNELTYYMAI